MQGNIKTEEEYFAAAARVDELMDLCKDINKDSEDCNELMALALSVMLYEEEHYPMEVPSRFEMFVFNLDRKGGWRGSIARMIFFVQDFCRNLWIG